MGRRVGVGFRKNYCKSLKRVDKKFKKQTKPNKTKIIENKKHENNILTRDFVPSNVGYTKGKCYELLERLPTSICVRTFYCSCSIYIYIYIYIYII